MSLLYLFKSEKRVALNKKSTVVGASLHRISRMEGIPHEHVHEHTTHEHTTHEHATHEHTAPMDVHAGHDHGHGGDCMTSHAMVFHASVCQEILFSGWHSRTGAQLLGWSLAALVAGVLYEALKYGREALHRRAARPRPSSQLNITKSECGPAGCEQTALEQSMWSSSHVVQSLLHILQSAFSYILMLLFMTYNVWLCAALVLGLGIGYFLFGWKKQSIADVTEHCQ